MGQFIDTQQGLLSEAKQKRLEREQRKREKQREQELERQLFYYLDSFFNLEDISISEYKNQYIKLCHTINRAEIINELTRNPDEVYYLEKKYNSILNNIYRAYKPIYENNKQAKREQLKQEQKQKITIKSQQKQNNNKNLSKTAIILITIFSVILEISKILLIIFGVPIIFIFSFLIHKK